MLNKKQLVLTIFWMLFGLMISAQTALKKNSIYFEFGGSGLFASVNYERQILKNTRLNFHVGTGIYGARSRYLTIPFGLNYLFKLSDSNLFIRPLA